MGTDIEPVPVTGLAANFSPMPRMAPPPLGKTIAGAEVEKASCPGPDRADSDCIEPRLSAMEPSPSACVHGVWPMAADLRSQIVVAECLILARRPLRRRDGSVTRWDAGSSRRGSRHFPQPVMDYLDGRVHLRNGLAALHPLGDVGGETDLNT